MLRNIRSRLPMLAILLLPIAALAACDSPTDGDIADIIGVWEAQQGDLTVFLDISESEVGVYAGTDGECFEHNQYDMVHTGGDTYTLSVPGMAYSEELVIRRTGDQLAIGDPVNSGSVAYYNQSTEDVSQLEICAGGGADPDIVCTDLPEIEVGASVTGSLTSTDSTSVYGSYYDLYRLELTSARQVRIDLGSDELDSFLVVYEADGTLVDQNDDADEDTLDASLTLDLDAGCYRIEATSFHSGETGSYTLSVN